MEEKIKVLFVVSEFWQAGTQRFTYELDRALNKERFSVEILSLLPLNSSNRWVDYYYPKHLELGTKIHFLNGINQRSSPTLKQNLQRRLVNKPYPDEHFALKSFFNQFDCISIMGEYNFKEIYQYITIENKQKLLIHVQNSKFQVPTTYDYFPKDQEFHFVSGFHEGQIEFELSEFKSFKHTYYNLNFKFENTLEKTKYQSSKAPKIGIFTRLTPVKPLDPFIYTFQLVVEQFPEAELNIYGSGDPVKEGVSRYIEQLKLEEKVIFRGHQENILKTAVEDNLDLVWVHGYHGLPGGWVSFDLSTAKFPQLFWNFGATQSSKNYSFFSMFHSIREFAEKSVQIIQDPILAKSLALEQFQYTNTHYNIENNIHVMEELYQSLKPSKTGEK
jgi:glycosyltransferase involved in cell wall biosynthesis